MQETVTARLRVGRAPAEAQDAARARLGGHIREDFLKEAVFTWRDSHLEMLGLLNKWTGCCSRIRMEQLMSITQEETENLRRREIACESQRGDAGERRACRGVLGTEIGWLEGAELCPCRSPVEGTDCYPSGQDMFIKSKKWYV